MPGRSRVEHPANCATIDVSTVDAESYDAPGIRVQDDEYPMRLKRDRFASEEVYAPQAVFCMTKECEPRGAGAWTLWIWPIAGSEYAAYNVLVDFNVECPRDDHRDSLAPETRIALLDCNDGCSQLWEWAFRARLCSGVFWRTSFGTSV